MAKWWEDKPWRMIQTNLREIDMLDIDADQFVRDLQTFQATAVLFNCAGIIASYPTELPFHYQSPFLQGDSLGEIIEACHAADIRLLARTDFSKVRRPLYEMHPDWAYRTVSGDIVDYNGDVHVCVMGDYQQVYALRIMEELLTGYDVDGIFFNMGGFQTRDYSGNYYGPCHCAACQVAFEEMFGLPLPLEEDMTDPVFRKYQVFRDRAMSAFSAQVREFIHGLRPDIAIDKDYQRRSGFIRQESNTAVDRPLPHWQYSGSSNTNWAVGTYPNMVSSNTTVDFVDFPYRHVAVSPHQQKLRLAQSLANGGQIDWYLIGRIDNHEDRSGFAPVKEMFAYHAAHEAEYVGNRSKANVLLLNDSRCGTGECRGWYRVLTENHFFFDAPLVDTAVEQDWEQYELVILPDLKYLSDDLIAKLDEFVSAGGALLATYQSGFYDSEYEARPQPGLESLGIDEVEWVREDMRSSYFKLDDKAGFPRFDDVDLIYMDGPYVYATYGPDADQRFRLIPPHNFGPPERCYYELVVDRPAFTANRYGQGRAIYVPWLPGALFHRQGHTNTPEFMADLVEHMAGVTPVKGQLSSQVEVTRFANKKGFDLIHLVNTSGHFGNTFYEPVTMRDVELVMPCEQEPRQVESLVTGETVDAVYDEGLLTLMVPELGLLEAFKLTW